MCNSVRENRLSHLPTYCFSEKHLCANSFIKLSMTDISPSCWCWICHCIR